MLGSMVKTVTIRKGQSLSEPVNAGGLSVVAVIFPSGWTAADLTFSSSPDEGFGWNDVYTTAGLRLVITAGANREARGIAGLDKANWLRLRSGNSEKPVAQGDDRQIKLVLA
jgi:hypothetical protein